MMKLCMVLALGFCFASGVAARAEESTDPFLAPETDLPAPVTPPSTPDTPKSAETKAAEPAKAANATPPSSMDNPPPALDTSTPPAAASTTPPAAATPAAPPPPAPAEQPPVPLASIPGKTENSPPAAALPSNPNPDIYDEYYEYRNAARSREKAEKEMELRSLFSHENGAWQVSLDFHRNAFSNFNFNNSTSNTTKVYGDSSGPGFSVNYFPVRSLAYGRLGFGFQGANYWTKFSWNQGAPIRFGSIIGYGIKAVYELDYFLGQLLVPFGFVGRDWADVRTQTLVIDGTNVDTTRRNVSATSYGGGFHFNLNRVEPGTASRALVNVGVKKFYLTYTATERQAALSGLTHSLGLRFEF